MPAPHLLVPRRAAIRYVQPLREGGSLPAIVDTDDGLFVVKFRGAGQGVKVLVAEYLVGELARLAGLPVPDLALVEIPATFGKNEPDPEIRELLKASRGTNLGMRYLDGAFNLDMNAAGDFISPELAAKVVWLDAFTTNPDRTHHNPNLMIWNRAPWLIDHGAALYAHHDWDAFTAERATQPFNRIRDHVLLLRAASIADADTAMCEHITPAVIDRVAESIPDELLDDPAYAVTGTSPNDAREKYAAYFRARLSFHQHMVSEITQAQELLRRDPRQPRTARR